MTQTLKTISRASAVALALGLLAGCATTDNGALSAQVEEAKTQSAQALQTANEAKAQSEAAMNAANEAKEMANRAQGIARAAEFQVDRLAKKQEQMFKKSMYK